MAIDSVHNDSHNVGNCTTPDWFPQAAFVVERICHFVMLPLYLTACVAAHFLILTVCLRRAKTESAYLYQVFLSVAETMEAVALVLSMMALAWGGMDTKGELWYRRHYSLMIISTYVVIPFSETCITNSLLLATAMAMDRVLALYRPVIYKTIHHHRRQILTVLICLVISLISSAYSYLLLKLRVGEEAYEVVPDMQYIGGAVGSGLNGLCTAIRATSLLVLIVCNYFLIKMVRSRNETVAKMTATIGSNDKQRQRKFQEKRLTQLTIYLSVCRGVLTFTEIAFLMGIFKVTEFVCLVDMVLPALTIVMQIIGIANAVTPILVCKSLRDSVRAYIRNAPTKQVTSVFILSK